MRQASIGYQCPKCASNSTPVIRGISKSRFIPSPENNQVTKFLGISLISIYVAQIVFGDILISNFALFAPSISTGQWWRLLTAGFLHGSILHLLFNVYILWVLGSQLESILGKTKFIIIYFVSLISGSLASFLFSPFGTYSIGASGAIFGLMGAMLVVGRKKRLDISQVAVLVVLNVVIGFVLSGIDWRAHLGGLAAGSLIAWVFLNATWLKEKTQ
ncbi:MAG: rhomboid family intramembrane serine protease [Actinomycetota bacterium]|nr:rhomboid family intramembrane serine protease [Actinomycetota bacterium]